MVAKKYGPTLSTGQKRMADEALLPLGVEELWLPAADTPDDSWREIVAAEETNNLRRWQATKRLPNVWLAEQLESIDPITTHRASHLLKATEGILRVNGGWRDLRRVAILEGPVEFPELYLDPPDIEESKASMQSYSRERMVLSVASPKPMVVVLPIHHEPGWEFRARNSTVDWSGPTRPVNSVMQGFCLPPGEFEVEVAYRPMRLKLGGLISFLSWSLLSLCGLIWFIRRRAESPRQ